MRRVVALLLVTLLATTACAEGDDDAAARPSDGVALVGDDVGDWTLAGLGEDAEPIDLAARRGQPVVLNFFASYCAPCVREMPALEADYQELGDRVAFVGVAVQDRASDALALVERTGVTFTIGADPDGELYAASGSTLLPATLVLDADGEVVSRLVGELGGDELRDALVEDAGLELS